MDAAHANNEFQTIHLETLVADSVDQHMATLNAHNHQLFEKVAALDSKSNILEEQLAELYTESLIKKQPG